jgi:Mg-chelatase subunit ChlD
MNQELTDITFLMDRSGSMHLLKREVVNGVNSFIAEQKLAKGDAVFTLIQFDGKDPNEYIHTAIPIKEVPRFPMSQFAPRGNTPLMDAIGFAIVKAGRRIKSMPRNERPGKVVFVIFTDGYENASRKYDKERIGTLIENLSTKYHWEFMFLGADTNAMMQGNEINIPEDTTLDISSLKSEIAIELASEKLRNYRATNNSADFRYTSIDRKKVK